MFRVSYQVVEVDTDLAMVTGRKDIVFFPLSNQEEIYLCLEAKRLNAIISGIRRSLADKYVKDGMQRFVDGKYARSVRHGVMLAYVLDGYTERAIQNVETNIRNRYSELRMEKETGFAASTIRPDDSRTKETRHRRAHEKHRKSAKSPWLAGAQCLSYAFRTALINWLQSPNRASLQRRNLPFGVIRRAVHY